MSIMGWLLSAKLVEQEDDAFKNLSGHVYQPPDGKDAHTMFSVMSAGSFELNHHELWCESNMLITDNYLVLSGLKSTVVASDTVMGNGESQTEPCLATYDFGTAKLKCADVVIAFRYSLRTQPETIREKRFRFVKGKGDEWYGEPTSAPVDEYCNTKTPPGPTPPSPTQEVKTPHQPFTPASVMDSGALADDGLITGKQIREMANEWVMSSPSMLEDTPAKVELKRRILRRKFHITFKPLMKRANELSAQIIIRIPPEYGSRRQDKDKEYAEFFRKALNGYDYDNIEADKSGQYLIDISNELADSFRRSSETQK